MKNNQWVLKVFMLAFIISLLFSGVSNYIASNSNIIVVIILIIVTIFIGVLADLLGTSVLTAKEKVFHAKSAKKIKGSKEAIKLIKNADIISNFCNDIIGDICSIVSGSLSAVLSVYISYKLNINVTISTFGICALLSGFTVGGKALGKIYAIKSSDKVLFFVGKILHKLKRNKKVLKK